MKLIHLAILVFAITVSAEAGEYHEQARQLKMAIPEGYQPMPKIPPQLLAGWFKRGANNDDLWTLNLSEFGGLLPEGGLPSSAIPSGMTASVIEWHDERVTCIRIPEKSGDLEYVNFQAILPASPKALRVSMGALKAQEAELKTVFASIIASVEVPIQYQSSGKMQAVLKIVGGLAMIAASIGLVVWVRRNMVERK